MPMGMLAFDFDPAAQRGEFTEHAHLWRLYLDLVELDQIKLQALVQKHHDNEHAGKLFSNDPPANRIIDPPTS